MPLPAPDAPVSAGPLGSGPRGRSAGSTRRDPLPLLAAATVLLVLRIALGILQPAPPAARGPGTAHAPGFQVRGSTSMTGDLVRWRTLAGGLTEARATGRPLLYDFTAEWCPPCRLLQREVFADPGAAAQLERGFVPVRVLDRQREEGHNAAWVDSLQTHYGVNAFPTLIADRADGTGEPVRLEGYMGRDLTLQRLATAAATLGGDPGSRGR
jgi:thiol:disulfide interchange protein